MTDYNPNDINISLQFQNDSLNKTVLESRVLVGSLDNEIEKLKLENKRLTEQVHKLTIIKEKYEPEPEPEPLPKGFVQALSSEPLPKGFVQALSSEPLPKGFVQALSSVESSDTKNIKTQSDKTQSDKTQSDKKESYFNIMSYFRK
jgi:hypothetical protein